MKALIPYLHQIGHCGRVVDHRLDVDRPALLLEVAMIVGHVFHPDLLRSVDS